MISVVWVMVMRSVLGGMGERLVEQGLGHVIADADGELVETEEEEAQVAASLPTPYMPTLYERNTTT